jgi:hypothetical protein
MLQQPMQPPTAPMPMATPNTTNATAVDVKG